MGWVANFLQFLVFYFLITTMALYAIKEFNASETAGGLAASAIVIGAIFSRFVSGYIIDRFGRRKIVLISVIATTIACALYIPIDSWDCSATQPFLPRCCLCVLHYGNHGDGAGTYPTTTPL